MFRIHRWLITILTVMAVMVTAVSVASAHAYIVKSNPVQNAALSSVPQQIQIWFDENVQADFGGLTVVNDKNVRVDNGDAGLDVADHRLLECTLKPNLNAGFYTIHWRVVSADGHPVEGVIPFSVGMAAGGAQTQASTTGYMPGWDMMLIRWLQFVSATLFFGLPLFWRFVLSPDVRKQLWAGWLSRWVWWAWGGLFVGALLSLPLEATIYEGVSWRDALSPDSLLKILLYSSYGPPWLVQFVLLMALLLILKFVFTAESRSRVGLWIILVSGLVFFGARSVTGHARESRWGNVSIVLDVIHQAGAALWIGGMLGLILLYIVVRASDTIERQAYVHAVRRFAGYAIGSVVVLAATGTLAAVQHIPTWYSLIHTRYGQTLLVKVCLVAVMGVLGAIQYFSVRRPKPGDSSVGRRFMRVEFYTGILILLITTMLVNLPTARSNPGPVNSTHVLSDKQITAHLQITPNEVGMNTFQVTLTDVNGKAPAGIQQVTLKLEMTEMPMGVDEIRLQQVSPGRYTAKGMYLTMAGDWNAQVHVLKGDFSAADGVFHIIAGSLPSNQ